MRNVFRIATASPAEPAANSEEKFRLAVEACPSGMVMTEREGNIVLVNSEAERLFGYERDELIGRPVETLFSKSLGGDCLESADSDRRPERRRLAADHDLFGRRKNGSEFPIEIRLKPLHTREGPFVLSVIVDISERKRVERLKDEFVSTVSHELRTPLTSIAGSLGLLIGGAAGKLPDPVVRLLTIAHTNSQRLVRLINDILDVEKIESGEVVFKFKRIDLRALIEQVLEASRGFADEFTVRTRLDPASIAAEVYADPDRLAQVLTNLLSNAIKFSPRDSEVTVSVVTRGDLVRICVRDRGPGIPPEFKPRVFERFAQAESGDARQKNGTGLGLSIVSQIIARLGGTVGFEDAEGGGTTFYVDLYSSEHFDRRRIDKEQSADAVRILYCEDDPDAAAALRESLRPYGYSTDFAYDPEAAIRLAAAACYAAIVIDSDLMDAGGGAFIRRLREQPESYKTPLVVSAERGGHKPDAADLVGLDWIDRPVDIDQLVAVLARVAIRGPNGRPRILHVDDDHDALEVVAVALKPIANVISVDSIEEAQKSLMQRTFDLAILDIMLGRVSGLTLLPNLHASDGTPIPVIIFSAYGAELAANAQVEARLDKSLASLEDLIAAVHDRLMLRSSIARQEHA